MTTHSLPSQVFPARSLRDWLAPLAGLFARRGTAARPTAGESAAEAARRVREYAGRIRAQDPRMAAELCAAADRHERQHPR